MSHRAGYFDPGFKGTITLEITGANETIRDGTSALKVKYEKLSSPARKPYTLGYSGQTAPLLGKNFV
jgi:deoxycytidine triphosphate deaminase